MVQYFFDIRAASFSILFASRLSCRRKQSGNRMNLVKIFTYGGIIEVFVVPHILPYLMSCIPSHITDMIQLSVAIISGLFPHVTVNMQSEVFLKVWNDQSTLTGNTQRNTLDEPVDDDDTLCERHKNAPKRASTDDDYRSRFASKFFNDDCDPRQPETCESAGTTTEQPSQSRGNDKRTDQMIYSLAMQLMNKANKSHFKSYEVFDEWGKISKLEASKSKDGTTANSRNRVQTGELSDTRKSSVNPDFFRSCSLEYVTKLKKDDKHSIRNGVNEARNGFHTRNVDLIDDVPEQMEIVESIRASCDSEWKQHREAKENKVSFCNPSSTRKTLNSDNDTPKPVYFGSNFQNL